MSFSQQLCEALFCEGFRGTAVVNESRFYQFLHNKNALSRYGPLMPNCCILEMRRNLHMKYKEDFKSVHE